MNIELTANIHGDRMLENIGILGGKFKLPVKTVLKLGPDGYFICCSFDKHDTQNLTLDTLLKDPFNISPPFRFQLEKAGFFTYHTQSNSNSLLVSSDIQPASLSEETIKCKQSKKHTSFWFEFNVDKCDLFRTILDLGYHPKKNIISLQCTLNSIKDSDLPSKRFDRVEYILKVSHIKLFSIFDFNDLTFIYKFEEENSYKIHGALNIDAFESDLSFCGEMICNETCLTANIISDDKFQPFKFMSEYNDCIKTLTIENPTLHLHYYFHNRDQSIKNKMEISSSIIFAHINCDFKISFINFSANSLEITLNNKIDLKQLFLNTVGLEPSNVQSNDFVNVIFEDKSNLKYTRNSGSGALCKLEKYYKLDEITKIEKYKTNDHYFIFNSRFTLTVFTQIHLHGELIISKNTIQSSISMDPIDLFFLKLVRAENCTGIKEGPEFFFTISKKNSNFGMHANVKLFDCQNGFDLKIVIRNDSQTWKKAAASNKPKNMLSLEGEITLTENDSFFLRDKGTIRFSYSHHNGFKLNNLERNRLVENLINFGKEIIFFINNITSSSMCGKLSKSITNKAINTKYDFSLDFSFSQSPIYSPSFIDSNLATNSISITVSVSISFYIFDVIRLVDLKLPKLFSFSIPYLNIKLQTLDKLLRFNLKGAITQIIDTLMRTGKEHQYELVILLCFYFTSKVIEVVATLFCKKIIDKKVYFATMAAYQFLLDAGLITVTGLVVNISKEQSEQLKEHVNEKLNEFDKLSMPLNFNIMEDNLFISWQDIPQQLKYKLIFFYPEYKKTPIIIDCNNCKPDENGIYKVKVHLDMFKDVGLYTCKLTECDDQSDDCLGAIYFYKLETPELVSSVSSETTVLKKINFTIQLNDYGISKGKNPSVFIFNKKTGTHFKFQVMKNNALASAICHLEDENDNSYVLIEHEFQDTEPSGIYSFQLSYGGNNFMIDSESSNEYQWYRLELANDFQVFLRDSGRSLFIQWGCVTETNKIRVQIHFLLFDIYGKIRERYVVVDYATSYHLVNNFSSSGVSILAVRIRTLTYFNIDTSQIPSIWGDFKIITLVTALSFFDSPSSLPIIVVPPAVVAKEDYNLNITGKHCAVHLGLLYPSLDSVGLALSMRSGGYSALETSLGLKSVIPQLHATELCNILSSSYGLYEDLPYSIAHYSFSHGFNGDRCGELYRMNFPSLNTKYLITCMQTAGYDINSIAHGLKSFDSSIKVIHLTDELISIFRRDK